MSAAWLPPAWSKSQLATLLDGCAWQWVLSKVAGLEDPGSPATARGTAYHAGVELHERSRLLRLRDGHGPDIGLDRMQTHARAVLGAEVAGLPDGALDLHGTSTVRLERELEQALTNWWSAPADLIDGDGGHAWTDRSLRDRLLDMRPVAIEPYVRVDVGTQRPAHGYIDGLYWSPRFEGYVVVDHKTANGLRRWDGPWGHEVEAAVYTAGAALARNLPPDSHVRMEWHVARSVANPRGQDPAARIVSVETGGWPPERVAADAIARAEQKVTDGDLPTNPDWNLCSAKWCAFFEGCQVTGDLSPQMLLTSLHRSH